MILRFEQTTDSEDSSSEGGSFDTVAFYIGALIAAGISFFLADLVTNFDGKLFGENMTRTLLATSILSMVLTSIFFEANEQFGKRAFLRIRNKLSKKRVTLMVVGFLTLAAADLVTITFCWILMFFLGDSSFSDPVMDMLTVLLIPVVIFILATIIAIRLAARIVCGHSVQNNDEH